MANHYKSFIQNQFEKVKSTASEFISPRSEDQEDRIELDPQAAEELREIAAAQHTTVQAIVDEIIDQYLLSASNESAPFSVYQKEDNPLLYLDGICKLDLTSV